MVEFQVTWEGENLLRTKKGQVSLLQTMGETKKMLSRGFFKTAFRIVNKDFVLLLHHCLPCYSQCNVTNDQASIMDILVCFLCLSCHPASLSHLLF